jgi:hypothetical protein
LFFWRTHINPSKTIELENAFQVVVDRHAQYAIGKHLIDRVKLFARVSNCHWAIAS